MFDIMLNEPLHFMFNAPINFACNLLVTIGAIVCIRKAFGLTRCLKIFDRSLLERGGLVSLGRRMRWHQARCVSGTFLFVGAAALCGQRAFVADTFLNEFMYYMGIYCYGIAFMIYTIIVDNVDDLMEIDWSILNERRDTRSDMEEDRARHDLDYDSVGAV